MALIKCPECGKEISDKAKSCPNCGYPTDQIAKDVSSNSDAEWENNRKVDHKKIDLKKILLLLIVAIILCLGIFIISKYINKNNEYKNAVNNYENGNYKEAYAYFSNSDFKDSDKYFEDTLLKYVNQLIEEKDFESADPLIKIIENDDERKEIEKKIAYMRGIEAYESGAFKLAIDAFSNVSGYQDTDTYINNAKFMNNIQGQWILSGSAISFYKTEDYNFAAIDISGWNATLFYCTDGDDTYKEVGTNKLEISNTDQATFKTNDVEYDICFMVDSISANIVKDAHFEKLKKSNSPFYVWKHYGDKNKLAFYKSDIGIPKPPAIGMTSDEVRLSTWGEPEKINKTTYSWGTTEQWCYSDNKYVYLDNGIVTAISE